MSKLLSQKDFLRVIKNNVDTVFGLEASFSIICIEPRAEEGVKYSPKETLGVISTAIDKSIVKENDCYSFFDNRFYIFTGLQNKSVIKDFLNSLVAKVGVTYGIDIYISAGFAQYPYDGINIQDVFAVAINNMERFSLKSYDFETGIISERDPNYVMGVELAHMLKNIKSYSEVLYNHSLLVAKISFEIAKKFKFANQAVKKLVIAAILHDIGYTMISKDIFLGDKSLKLKNSKTIKLHPLLATRKILQDKYLFRDVFDLIEHHHEFLDGGGYPFGLSRVDLTLESQIISLADTYAAIYEQSKFSIESIIDFFDARSGIRWDMELVETFIAILSDEITRATLHNINKDSLKEIFDIS